MADTVTDVQKRAAEANEKLGADARKRGEEMAAKRAESTAERSAAEAERDDLASKSQAVEQALNPYYGLFPSPARTSLHVIPAGMWRYQTPITPALESMVPPTEEADPNYVAPPEEAKGDGATFVRGHDTAARAQAAAAQHPNKAQHP